MGIPGLRVGLVRFRSVDAEECENPTNPPDSAWSMRYAADHEKINNRHLVRKEDFDMPDRTRASHTENLSSDDYAIESFEEPAW